jgi:hypothetical protein
MPTNSIPVEISADQTAGIPPATYGYTCPRCCARFSVLAELYDHWYEDHCDDIYEEGGF